MTGYVQRHWRGEQSLARSFWLNNILLGAIVVALIGYLVPEDAAPSIRAQLAWIWLSTPLALLLAVWQLVGLWRSAARRIAETNRRWMPRLAKLFVAVNVLAIGTGMAVDATGSVQLFRALRDPDLTEYRLIVDEVAQTAIFYGALSDDSADRLIQALIDGRYATLRIDSHGGLLQPAVRLARRIRERNVRVAVEEQCISACVLLLAASSAGAISPQADVVLHRSTAVVSRLPWLAMTPEERMNGALFREFGVRAVIYGQLREHEFWQPTLRQMGRGRLIDFIIDPVSGEWIPAGDWCASRAEECDAARWAPES